MLAFLQKIKDEHRDDDDMLIALGEIESELTSKKYGLVWEQHEEAVDVMMLDNIPVFTEVPEREITAAPGQGYNFILEGDSLHSLHLLSKTHRGKIDVIYIDPPYNTKNKDFIYDDKRIDATDGFQHMCSPSLQANRSPVNWHTSLQRCSRRGPGRREVLIATHIDREHIHSHFIVNSVCFGNGKMLRQRQNASARAGDAGKAAHYLR